MHAAAFGLSRRSGLAVLIAGALLTAPTSLPAATAKPPLHAREWLAITGKPLAATAGARIFLRGGNAVDAACAMLAATATMWDTLGWGGETQALIWHPELKKVIGINALGVAPSGATAEFFATKGLRYPPEDGPLAAVTPGTPGGLLVMLAEYGTLSLREILAPAREMASGYPIEAQLAEAIERQRPKLTQWPASARVFLPHRGESRESPRAGELFRQPELAATLDRLIEAETQALAAGRSRREAILAAYERFYRGDIARDLVSGARELGGLLTAEDLARWRVEIEEPVHTSYRGLEVYKLTVWTQGPAMLQALNLLEGFDLKAMGYNSARYIHTVYQAMNLAFADRDFYYGDPYRPPEEPVRGLLSKEYAAARRPLIDAARNHPEIGPGDPYPFQGQANPFAALLVAPASSTSSAPAAPSSLMPAHDQRPPGAQADAGMSADEAFRAGTTSIVAADAKGWVVAVTPSGGWVPAVVAGTTGIGLSQRMQSFVLDQAESPFNVVAPGQRPRVTLTPTLVLKDGAPWLAMAVQGGDTQDQNLLQFFLAMTEFGMTVQEATEAPNFTSYQMKSSFGDHRREPGRLTVNEQVPEWVRAELRRMGYRLDAQRLTSGPINAIWFDRTHGTMWGGSSNHGEDYGIGW